MKKVGAIQSLLQLLYIEYTTKFDGMERVTLGKLKVHYNLKNIMKSGVSF